MVMGPTHSLSGATFWLALATFAGSVLSSFQADSIPVILMGTLITAGAALAPDIDSHSSTVVNSFGVLGKAGHRVADAVSVAVYETTRTRYDKPRTDGHRTLFHTTLAAIVAGGLVALGGSLGGMVEIVGKEFTWGQISSLTVMFIFTHLALAGLFEKQVRKARRKYGPYLLMLSSAVITLITASLLPEGGNYPWLGFAVGLGWFVHLLGDAITKMGVPLMFPLKYRGKRWWDVTLPSFMRIRAGGTFEKVVLLPTLTVLTTILVFTSVPAIRDFIWNLF